MTTSEKVAYLKGLAEGMNIDQTSGDGKLFGVIIEILEDLARDQAETRADVEDLGDCLDSVSDDLETLENIVYDDDDDDDDEDDDEEEDEDDDPVFYSVECPGCGFKLTVDEDIVDSGEFECPECGEVIDFTKAKVEEVLFDDEEDDRD